jgi:hypothetical protein
MRRVWSVAALIVSFPLLLGLAVGPPAAAAESGLRLVRVRHSLLGTHTWYQQTYGGIPVLGGYLARHDLRSGTSVDEGRAEIVGLASLKPTVPAVRARSAAISRAPGAPDPASLAILPGTPARLVWEVVTTGPRGSVQTLVEATTGAILSVTRLVLEVDGTGRVFDPNPVVTLQDQSLTDQDDADQAVLQPAYRVVSLAHLDGSGFLRGDFAQVTLKKKFGPAFESSLSFLYDRLDDRFEQVMAYYNVTTAQEYLQSLGFTEVNNESQDLLPNAFKGDNSFYNPKKDTITLGIGGVDDGEDADVTWHEFGHAIQDDQVPGFGKRHDAGSIGEGFSDYFAVTMSIPVNGGYEVPCVADWDSVSYTSTAPHCLRRVDEDLTLADQTGEIHDDGRIWSRALWDIHVGLGRTIADTIILEAQFRFAPDTSFAAAAQATVDTALALYGDAAAGLVRAAFEARGIL